MTARTFGKLRQFEMHLLDPLIKLYNQLSVIFN